MFYHNLHLMLPFLLSTYIPAEPDTELRIVPLSLPIDTFLRTLKMSLIVLLLLCLSLHACSARPLQVNSVEGTGGSLQPSSKQEIAWPAVDEYSRVKERMIVRIGEGTTLTTCCGETTGQQKISEELGGRNEKNKGKNMVLSSARVVMHEMIKVEDERRQGRTLESRPSDDAEENVGAKENDMGEDIVVMDYAQPHRKPPIHNKEP